MLYKVTDNVPMRKKKRLPKKTKNLMRTGTIFVLCSTVSPAPNVSGLHLAK